MTYVFFIFLLASFSSLIGMQNNNILFYSKYGPIEANPTLWHVALRRNVFDGVGSDAYNQLLKECASKDAMSHYRQWAHDALRSFSVSDDEISRCVVKESTKDALQKYGNKIYAFYWIGPCIFIDSPEFEKLPSWQKKMQLYVAAANIAFSDACEQQWLQHAQGKYYQDRCYKETFAALRSLFLTCPVESLEDAEKSIEKIKMVYRMAEYRAKKASSEFIADMQERHSIRALMAGCAKLNQRRDVKDDEWDDKKRMDLMIQDLEIKAAQNSGSEARYDSVLTTYPEHLVGLSPLTKAYQIARKQKKTDLSQLQTKRALTCRY